jgi:hypothetical protein
VLSVIGCRGSVDVGARVAASSQARRDAVEVVATGPPAAFGKALREQLPAAVASVDAFRLVEPRQRHGHRRSPAGDPRAEGPPRPAR